MTIVEADIQEKILLLSFEERFNASLRSPAELEAWMAEPKNLIKQTIAVHVHGAISMRRNNSGLVERRFSTFSALENFYDYAFFQDEFFFSADVISGSVYWKDGEIRITPKAFGILLFLFLGGFDFLSKYESAVSGADALLRHIRMGYEFAVREIDFSLTGTTNPSNPSRIPSQSPPSDRVAREVMHVIREDELREIILQLNPKELD
jgi:hypothetical protein